MSKETVKIQSIEKVTHDVLKFITEKPNGFEFEPGQATEIAINKSGWEDEGRPFTFTSLPKDDYLEFTIKSYTDHDGVTNKLTELSNGDEFLMNEVFGAIQYQGEGAFIAGGAGVTPFISILRKLRDEGKVGENQLIFANKTQNDIIHQDEFENMLGDNFINILSREDTKGYANGHISKEFLKENINNLNKKFYVCGPPPMMESVLKQLDELGVNEQDIITEDM